MTETGGMDLKIDDETGKPYWELWGEGWKDSTRLDIDEAAELHPTSFPPGTRVVIMEPVASTTGSYYSDPDKYYPITDKQFDALNEAGMV